MQHNPTCWGSVSERSIWGIVLHGTLTMSDVPSFAVVKQNKTKRGKKKTHRYLHVLRPTVFQKWFQNGGTSFYGIWVLLRLETPREKRFTLQQMLAMAGGELPQWSKRLKVCQSERNISESSSWLVSSWPAKRWNMRLKDDGSVP